MSDQVHDSVLAVAADAVSLIEATAPHTVGTTPPQDRSVSGAALWRLAALLDLQTRLLAYSPDGLALIARGVLETWITGHTARMLGDSGVADLQRRGAVLQAFTVGPSHDLTADRDAPTLTDLARRLDLQAYGTADPPRAFQRHVASFYDEIDISGAEGTVSHLAGRSATAPASHEDYVRVSLWVVLFLAYDHFAVVGSDDAAKAARQLFDRLRRVTDDFYAHRRLASRVSSCAAPSDAASSA